MADLEALKSKALAMPASPGVYLMKDKSGRVIYVGKAKVLPRRVSSYFQKTPDSYKTAKMVSLVADVDYMITATEKEAFILENSLIKKHRPKYNIILRDDKTYPYLQLTVNEPWPRIEVVRRIQKDGAVYFGPFSSASAMRQTLRLVRTLFPLRQCKRPDVLAAKRPCLNYQLGRCLGPCNQHATQDEYRAVVDEVILFFRGRNKLLSEALTTKMKEASDRFDYELAAKYRDRLRAVERTLEQQKVVSTDIKDQDVVGLARDRGQVLAVIMFIRRGVLLGSRVVPLGATQETDGPLIESLLGQYYSRDHMVPAEILVPAELENAEMIEEWLREKRGKGVKILTPVRGPKKRLIEMAEENAVTNLTERFRAADLGRNTLYEIQKKMFLPDLPHRIEGYDMSNLQGDAAVGAMVVLEDGKWVKSDYRRFKIKGAGVQNDYAMMSEVLERRLVKEDLPRPDLILLDGGRGQLGVVQAVIQDLEIHNPPPIAGIAKGREGESDRIWLPGRKNPVDFKGDAPGLLLLMRVRDEAHRYVRTYHHRLRAKGSTRSVLDDVPGVGPARRKALLNHFGSLDAIKAAGIDQLTEAKGMTRSAAEAVYLMFHEASPAGEES